MFEITLIEEEPRILDLDLAAVLEYARPRKIRDLIQSHAESLAKLGTIAPHSRAQLRANGSTHEVEEYYLNKSQAIFITTQSSTPKATEITVEVVKRFDEYERGIRVSPVINHDAVVSFMNLALQHLPNLGNDSKQLMFSKASKIMFGECLIGQPVIEERFWTTTEIAGEINVHPTTLGRVVSAGGLKNEKFGTVRLSKAKHSQKDVEQFYWNANGRAFLLSLYGIAA